MVRAVARLDKDADAKLDYVFDWSAQMDADTDGIASAVVSAPSGIALGTPTVTASTVQVFVSGGTEGTTYAIISKTWTTGGRRDEKVLELTITQQPSTSHSIVVETGTGSSTANSYASVANGDSYHASHGFADTWHQANDRKKEKALIWATRLLDENITWEGTKSTETQALQWPRIGTADRGGYSIQHTVIPQALKDATSEFARLLLVEDRTAIEESDVPRGFRRLKAGSLEMEFDSGSRADKKDLIPEHVLRMLGPFGASASGSGVIKLVRS